MSDQWLYQIRIRVDEETSSNLRHNKSSSAAKLLNSLAEKHGTQLVCTYDAFVGYCNEAEKNGVEDYPLYNWTKQTIENPEKKEKHLKSSPSIETMTKFMRKYSPIKSIPNYYRLPRTAQ